MKTGTLGVLGVPMFLVAVSVMPQGAIARLAPESPPAALPIAVVNIQNAISATEDGHRELEALEKKFNARKAELNARNEEVEGLKRQFDTQGPKMNDEARAALTGQINSKQRTLARMQEDVQADFNQEQTEIVQKILRKLAPIVDQYAKDKGLGLVIDNSKPWPEWPTVWVSPLVDITKEIVELYNVAATHRSSVPENRQPSKPPVTSK